MKALLVAGNYAEARLAMDHIEEDDVSFITDSPNSVMKYYAIERGTPIYFYGTYDDRDDLDRIFNLIKLRSLVQKNVIVKDGHWKGEL